MQSTRGAQRLVQKEFLAKGKRGIAYVAQLRGQKVLVKEHNPTASIDTIAHEARMQQLLNKHGIGPRFIAYNKRKGQLIREFVEGEAFTDYLEKMSKKEIIRVLTEIFYQCYKMDLLGINKFELTRPYKHILVTTKASKWRKKGEVLQIDFERCKETEKPKNVTQFAQCIIHSRVKGILSRAKIPINDDTLIELTKKYKNNYNYLIFSDILRTFTGTPRKPQTLSEGVYWLCTTIPEGKISTYKELARALNTHSYQAIGQALRRNPYAPHVPCHRIVKADGGIGGFAGATSGKPIKRKIALLKAEGIHASNGRISNFMNHQFLFANI